MPNTYIHMHISVVFATDSWLPKISQTTKIYMKLLLQYDEKLNVVHGTKNLTHKELM